jgi:hypothetical protein
MKFEDLFKTKEPTNYVEQPSEDQDPLTKFFFERSVKAQKAKQPITLEKEKFIKQNFALPQDTSNSQEFLDSEMDKEFNDVVSKEPYGGMEETSITEQPSSLEQPRLKIPNLSKEKDEKKESLSDMAEKMLPERTWKDFLPYLTPFLVEALAGGNANAAELAGSALMGAESDRMKRKQSLEDKLLEMQKASLLKKPMQSKLQSKSLRDKTTGESVIGSYDPITDTMYVGGKSVDTSKYELAPGLSRQEFEARSGITQQRQKELGEYFGRGVRLDPETGLLARVINGKLIPIQIQQGQLNPKQQKDLKSIISNFKTTDIYKKNADTLRFTGTLRSLIQEKNPISLEMAKSELAKAAEGGGRLTDQDVARLGGSRAVKEQVRRFAYLQRTGEGATPKDSYFMMRVADILEERARKNLSQSVIGMEKDFVENYGGIAGAVQTSFNPYAPELYQTSSANKPQSDKVKVEMLDEKGRPTGKFGTIPVDKIKDAIKSKKFKVVN